MSTNPCRNFDSVGETIRAVAAAAWVLFFGGCIHEVYELDLKPGDAGLHRDLTFWQVQGGDDQNHAPSPEEISAVEAVYGRPAKIQDQGKRQIEGDFPRVMPGDIGGAGWYWHLEAPGGTLHGYTERFRGNDDLATELDERQQALDRLIDLAIPLFAGKPEEEGILRPVREFLGGEFRHDARNLSLYLWTLGILGQYRERADEEIGVRMAQYLVERGYLNLDDVPTWKAAFSQAQGGDEASLLEHVQRMLVRKAGVADTPDASATLQRLLERQRLDEAVSQIAQGTDEYHRLISAWEEERRTKPELDRPPPKQVFEELAVGAFLPGKHFFSAADQLNTRLHLPLPPFATNGKWSQDAGLVSWSSRIPSRKQAKEAWPAVAYAFWSQPDESLQTRHFGKVVLRDQALADYVLWYHGLTQRRGDEWKRFLSELRGAKDVADRIKGFRFSDEPAGADPAQSSTGQSDAAKALLVAALEATE